MRGIVFSAFPVFMTFCGSLSAAAAMRTPTSSPWHPCRLWSRSRGCETRSATLGSRVVDPLVWRGTQHSFLRAWTPYFFQSRPHCPKEGYAIAGPKKCRAIFSTKIRLQVWARCARRDSVRAATAPVGARGESMASVATANWVVGARNALGAFGFEM